MKQDRYRQDIRADDTSEELIGVLTAISVVSKRLARRLTALSYQQHQADHDRPEPAERKHYASIRNQR